MTANTVAAIAKLMGGLSAPFRHDSLWLRSEGLAQAPRAPGRRAPNRASMSTGRLKSYSPSLQYMKTAGRGHSSAAQRLRLYIGHRDDFEDLDGRSWHGQVRVAVQDGLDLIGRAG